MSESKSLSLDRCEARRQAGVAYGWTTRTSADLAVSSNQSVQVLLIEMEKVDVTGVEPMAYSLPLHNVFRDDVVEPEPDDRAGIGH